jgi:heme exporter protein D
VSFDSLADFLAMGGHGLYVWLSYGAALLVVLYNVLSLRLARRRHIREATDRLRRNAGSPSVAARSGPQTEAGNP